MSWSDSNSFEFSSLVQQNIFMWWQWLEKNRGERAQFRRCRNLTEVVFMSSYHKFRESLVSLGYNNEEGLALIAVLIAYFKFNEKFNVKDLSGKAFGEIMASKVKPDRPLVSSLRFCQLLKKETREALLSEIRRILAVVGKNPECLMSCLAGAYAWSDEARKAWAYDYYASPKED